MRLKMRRKIIRKASKLLREVKRPFKKKKKVPTVAPANAVLKRPDPSPSLSKGTVAKEVGIIFSSMGLFPHGSLTAGESEWEKKWQRSEGKRILFYSTKDYSGSFYKWARAVNEHTDYAVRMITSTTHSYGYAQDLIVPRLMMTKNFPYDHGDLKHSHDRALELANEADVIHFKEECEWFTQCEDYLLWKLHERAKENNTPTVFTHYGGYARKYKKNKQYIEFVQDFDARIAMTPDLNYDWYDGYYIPHSIDTDAYSSTWSPETRTVVHSPSNKKRKNTDTFEAAVEASLKADPSWTYTQIHGVPHEECLALKQKSGLFFDQAGRENSGSLGIDDIIGWYGNSGIEGMVFGIPTIAHISEQAWQGAERAGKFIRDICPVVNTGITQESFEETLQNHFKLSDEQRCDIAYRTRQWAEDFHSFRTNGRELAEVYESLLSNSNPSQKSFSQKQTLVAGEAA